MGRKRNTMLIGASLAAGLFGLAAWSGGVRSQVVVYPAQGQSAEQMNKDRYECHLWAVQQSGYDPSNPQAAQASAPAAPAPSQEAPEGGVLRGAARGTVIGVVGGAIAGDAGKGAAIGAATGGLIGGFRRRDQRRRQDQAQQDYQRQAQSQAQVQAQSGQQRDLYNRSVAACLTGRGYTVN